MAEKRVYAIGFGKWVEIRISATPPEQQTTFFIRTIEKPALKHEIDAFGELRFRHVISKAKKKFTCTIFEGGSVVGVVTKNTLGMTIYPEFAPLKDQMIEIHPDRIEKVLKLAEEE
jgi:hypothetical protein